MGDVQGKEAEEEQLRRGEGGEGGERRHVEGCKGWREEEVRKRKGSRKRM